MSKKIISADHQLAGLCFSHGGGSEKLHVTSCRKDFCLLANTDPSFAFPHMVLREILKWKRQHPLKASDIGLLSFILAKVMKLKCISAHDMIHELYENWKWETCGLHNMVSADLQIKVTGSNWQIRESRLSTKWEMKFKGSKLVKIIKLRVMVPLDPIKCWPCCTTDMCLLPWQPCLKFDVSPGWGGS